MTWATNWDSSEGKGKLLKSALNDLRGAMDERCDAVGRTVPANCPVIATGDLVLSSWFSAFQSEMSTLITTYIDHTDNGGDWDGLATIPNWTVANILTELGETRVDAPTDPLISAPWLYQQYKLLELLRWDKISATLGTTGQTKQYLSNISWADCETNFVGATPTSSSFSFWMWYNGEHLGGNVALKGYFLSR